MSRYRSIRSFVDLHLLDRTRNHDKVYHLAIFERDNGCFDVLYRYGRRGTTMRLGIVKGGENVRDYQAAIRIMNRKEAQQVAGDGYRHADGVTPGIWDDLLAQSPPSPQIQHVIQSSEPENPEEPPHDIGGDGPASWFW